MASAIKDIKEEVKRENMTYGFVFSWGPACGLGSAGGAVFPGSCRTSGTPAQPPSRCPGTRRWHAGRDRRAGG